MQRYMVLTKIFFSKYSISILIPQVVTTGKGLKFKSAKCCIGYHTIYLQIKLNLTSLATLYIHHN